MAGAAGSPIDSNMEWFHGVAAIARPCHVVVECGGDPGDEAMTCVALISTLAECRIWDRTIMIGWPEVLVYSAQVATRILTGTRRYANVIPTCRNPGKSPVAAVTGLGRFLSDIVARWLGSGLSAVMTGQTSSRLRNPVVVASTEEGGGVEVTAFARCIGHDMAGGFRRRHNALAERMATIAVLWRALEHTTHVASLACRRSVSAGKQEAGCNVIEIAAAQLRFGNRV